MSDETPNNDATNRPSGLTDVDLDDDDDLFVSTYEKPPVNHNDQEQLNNDEAPKLEQPPLEANLESEMKNIDLNDTNETPKIEASNAQLASSSSVPAEAPVPSEPVQCSAKPSIPTPAINTASQIKVTVSDPQKMGEGMGSYMVYTVSTRTTLPYFRRQSMSVNRRFSDFLGLHSKLLMKHGHSGRIVPPPPAKSAVGTAKVKMAKDDSLHSMDFLAKRRAALERYLQRTAEHPVLCSDPDFREFLELDTELPRSTSTSALSGAGVKRLFSFVGDTVHKMTFRMEESDPWFESKQQQIEVLDAQLRKLHMSVESLMQHRKELTTSLSLLAKSTAEIGHAECNASLCCALSQLSTTHEKVEKVYESQANNDFLYLSELLRDYIAMIGAVREAFHERVKCFHNMTNLEQTLTRKKDNKTKLELANKNEPRLPQLEEEITELQEKVQKAKEDFEQISETIKSEFERFDLNRVRDFKNNFLKYMETMLETQVSLIECWEAFLPEAKSISV